MNEDDIINSNVVATCDSKETFQTVDIVIQNVVRIRSTIEKDVDVVEGILNIHPILLVRGAT